MKALKDEVEGLIKTIYRQTEEDIALQFAAEICSPAMKEIVGVIGARSTMALILAKGGRSLRVPRIEEVVKTMHLINALHKVREGGKPENVAREFRLALPRLLKMIDFMKPHWKRLDQIRNKNDP